jgi:hypothetical protein
LSARNDHQFLLMHCWRLSQDSRDEQAWVNTQEMNKSRLIYSHSYKGIWPWCPDIVARSSFMQLHYTRPFMSISAIRTVIARHIGVTYILCDMPSHTQIFRWDVSVTNTLQLSFSADWQVRK